MAGDPNETPLMFDSDNLVDLGETPTADGDGDGDDQSDVESKLGDICPSCQNTSGR